MADPPDDAAPDPVDLPAGNEEADDSQPGRGRRGAKKPAKPSRSAQYWMIVVSHDNYRRTREHGFNLQGIKLRHRKRAETIRPGDRILYYITGRGAFSATATVTGAMQEDRTVIWRSVRPDEDYPWRVRIRADNVLEEGDWLKASELAYRLEYVRKWPPEEWRIAFQGHLHQLSQKDFKLVEDEIRRARGRLRGRERRRGGGDRVTNHGSPVLES